jgi:hypothetical protein
VSVNIAICKSPEASSRSIASAPKCLVSGPLRGDPDAGVLLAAVTVGKQGASYPTGLRRFKRTALQLGVAW